MTTRRQFHMLALTIGAATLSLSTLAHAQGSDYPTRPIRIVVPFPAGGGPDVLTRKLAVKLGDVLGKGAVVIVDNVVGAGGILAAQTVARAAPDGYTLLLGASSHIVQKAMQPTVGFDPLKDFTHVTRNAFTPSILVVSVDSPYKSVEDLVNAARKNPGKFNYASGGIGSAAHLSAAAMVLQSGLDVVHVPYKGSVEIVPSIIAGDTQFAFPIGSTAIPLIRAGKVRALAVTSAQRMAALPEVPTLVEALKAPDLALDAWFGFWVPAGTPAGIVNTLFNALTKAYDDPALARRQRGGERGDRAQHLPRRVHRLHRSGDTEVRQDREGGQPERGQVTGAAWHPPPQALRGIRVLDFSHVIAGPFATFHLAQLGAEVTKIEKPGGGDVMRRTAAGGSAFTAFNAGKRIQDIDIGSTAGRAEVLALAREADVIVDNYRPGVLRRHGLAYEDIRAINPGIVYCAISGYGYSDPARTPHGAYDHVVQALTGMTLLAGSEGDPPVKTGFPVVDAATGIIGALAIVVALRERDRTGEGSFLDVSMWASALQLMYPFACETLTSGNEIPRIGNKGYSGSPAADTFACRDGWLAIGANTPGQIARLIDVLQIPAADVAPLLEPPAEGAPAFARARDPQAFRALLVARLAHESAADIEHRLNENSVPAARVRTLREFTREAVDTGLLRPVELGSGADRAVTPGLGWRTRRPAAP